MFRRRFLLIRHCAAAWSFARARVGMGALAPHRQAAAVPQSAVGAHLDVTLDVHRDFLAQVAFHAPSSSRMVRTLLISSSDKSRTFLSKLIPARNNSDFARVRPMP